MQACAASLGLISTLPEYRRHHEQATVMLSSIQKDALFALLYLLKLDAECCMVVGITEALRSASGV